MNNKDVENDRNEKNLNMLEQIIQNQEGKQSKYQL